MKSDLAHSLILIFACLSLSGCSDQGIDVSGCDILLMNRTGVTFIYLAFELEYTALYEIPDSVRVERYRDRITEPGETVGLRFDSRYQPGDNIRIIFYRVVLGSNKAGFLGFLDVDASELVVNAKRIVVRHF